MVLETVKESLNVCVNVNTNAKAGVSTIIIQATNVAKNIKIIF